MAITSFRPLLGFFIFQFVRGHNMRDLIELFPSPIGVLYISIRH